MSYLVEIGSETFAYAPWRAPAQIIPQSFPRQAELTRHPGEASGVADHVWSLEEVIALLDA